MKPLFDIQVEVEGEKGFVLPDIIIQAKLPDGREHSVFIKTMGYTEDEYCERKTDQHKGCGSWERYKRGPLGKRKISYAKAIS